MNFDFVGFFDVSRFKDILENINDDIWKKHKTRQTVFEAHKHTETIELMWDMESLNSGTSGKIHQNFYDLDIDVLLEGLEPVYTKKYGKGEFLRVLLVKLKSGKMIYTHSDSGESLSDVKRTHVAVITNPNVIFTVGGENKNMKEGEIWEINNQSLHSVRNDSEYDRVHFIIDYKQEISAKTKKSLL